MKVMVMVKATPSSEKGTMPDPEMLAAMGRYNEKLVEAGIMKSGDGLKPSSQAVRVRFSGDKRTVINGPFPETKELVAGYWIWEVKSMEEAVEWVKKCPNPMPEDSDIDIRPHFEMADFAEADPTGAEARREEELVTKLAGQSAIVHPYLLFGGRCDEALEFYKQAVGARVAMLMRFDESPDPMPEGMLAPGFERKVLHSEFIVGNITVMASDGCAPGGTFSGFSLALTVPTVEEVDRLFTALAEGGQVSMPLTRTFFSPRYGTLTDKFGVCWMVMAAMEGNGG